MKEKEILLLRYGMSVPSSNVKKQSDKNIFDYSIFFRSIVCFWKIFLMMTIQILAFISQGKSGGLAKTSIGLSQKGLEDLM